MKLLLTDSSNIHVLVVEPAASVRMLITDVLRTLGYKNLHTVASGKDAVKLLEIERVHWVIMPLMANESVNAIQILNLILNEPSLNHTSTTLLIEPTTEDFCLPLAFELGLLSWMHRSYVKEDLMFELQGLIKSLATNSGSVTLTAAEYIRGFLSEKRMSVTRQDFEQKLLECFPGSPKLLLHTAEAEILAGNENRAVGLINQAEIIDDKLKVTCKHMRDKYFRNGLPVTSPVLENTLGITTVVVIDPDSDVLFAASEMFHQIGVSQVETFENGAKAFDWLIRNGKEPDLIIMEWRIPGLSGPVLVQRIRQEGFLQVPIIIASSLVKRDEKPLLIEMGVDELLEKPFDKSSFFGAVVWAIQQNRMPTEQKSLERKFRRLVHSNQFLEAERLLAQLVSDPRAHESSKKGLQAEYLFYQADYPAACEMAAEALRLGGDSLSMLNIVGKSLLKLNQFEKALQCFDKANSICSMNIERLLQIAEINIQLGKPEEAAHACDAALSLDISNKQAGQLKCAMDIESGNLTRACAEMDKLDSVPRVAAYINNRAIALARAGRYEESIALYKRAIQCLETKWNELSTFVTYNLGLAYARYGDYEASILTLKPMAIDTSLRIQPKSLALLKRLEKTVKSDVRLFNDESDETIDLTENTDDRLPNQHSTRERLDKLMTQLSAKRGDIGCYHLFHSLEEIAVEATELIKNTPHFSKRVPTSQAKVENLKTGS